MFLARCKPSSVKMVSRINPSSSNVALYGSHTEDRLQQMKGELQSLNKGSSSLEDYLHKAKSLGLVSSRCNFPPLEGVIDKLCDFEICLQAAWVTSPNIAFYTNRGKTSTKSRGTHGSRGRPNYKADGCFASNEEAEQFKVFVALQVADTIKETWYPDTGANHHMTYDTSEVQGIHSYLGNDSIMVVNGNGLQIFGIGQVSLLATDITLNNVLIVLDIKKKLLLVSSTYKGT
ncbi:hypothetical protein POTOM_019134 [Populus tomentosa]|uniref:Retrovirus-related Pol polyprotein from transposon TNT 1-94-like beta-barrel domain-containing protein n=1 Tax=Populus tomentosa TaxID=118781 RepID=A0A8X7ZWM8_POPTO|nr:hypothetical protein POTOM_019134 [Populus tomentosa]